MNTSEMREIAKEATDGPWRLKEWMNELGEVGAFDVEGSEGEWIARCGLYPGNGSRKGNIAHIATFNPQRVKAMLDVIEAIQSVIDVSEYKHYKLEYALKALEEIK